MATTPSPNIEIIPIRPASSDADPTHRPKPGWRPVHPPHLYLEKLATAWLEAEGRPVRPGVRYYLDRLPEGYELFERERLKDGKLVDRHLYGHPRHKFFDSPNRFFPHFLHLMTHGSAAAGCTCTVCGGKGGVPLPMRGAGRGSGAAVATGSGESGGEGEAGRGAGGGQRGRPRGRGRPPGVRGPGRPPLSSVVQPKLTRVRHFDEEDTPDVIRSMLDRLKIEGTIDAPIEEKMSMDWRAERELLPKMLEGVAEQKAWIPRPGEVVLFVREMDGELRFDTAAQEYKVFNAREKRFTGHPRWEAGVVGQTPDEAVDLEDILLENGKGMSVNYSGFRVEPLPDPNSSDKSYTKKYTYVPSHRVRPFAFSIEYLKGTAKKDEHPTIRHGFKICAAMSLLEKFRFKGTWPAAAVFCKGIYIGPELICVGDTVRLLPSKESEDRVTNLLKVESIRLKFTNLDKATADDHDDGHPYNSTVHLTGKAYTIDPRRKWNGAAQVNPRPWDKYTLYPLHDPAKSYSTPFTRVLGRAFETEPMRLWFPGALNAHQDHSLLLSQGLRDIEAARAFGSQHDSRILPGKSWFWADSRAEALGVESVNGFVVAALDETREEELLDEWRKGIRVLERVADDEERAYMTKKPVGRPRKKMVRQEETEVETEMEGEGVDVSRKRSRSGNDDTEGDEEDVKMEDDEEEGDEEGVKMDDEEDEEDELTTWGVRTHSLQKVMIPMQEEIEDDEEDVDDDDDDDEDVDELLGNFKSRQGPVVMVNSPSSSQQPKAGVSWVRDAKFSPVNKSSEPARNAPASPYKRPRTETPQ